MELKKLLVYCFVIFYLYVLAFGIFMTETVKIPAPAVFGLPLIFFAGQPATRFLYYKEMLFFITALFLYNIVGMNDYRSFFATLITIFICALYFNYFVGSSRSRFVASIVLFFLLLMVSMIIMILDHNYASIIDPIRIAMLDEQVKQSPSGLSITQFTFGYQVAAFTTMILVAAFTFKQNLLIKLVVLCCCLVCVYLGMNRSAFISFCAATATFLIIYYRYKAVFLLIITILVCFAAYTYMLKDNFDNKNNILSKNTAKEANDFNRADLAAENLKIVANYPFGLIFYGKTWDEVTYRNPSFPFGLSSHNAYLMFVTLLGPFLGLGLLGAIYYRILSLFWNTVKNIHKKNQPLYLALFFSFFAISINALSHNGWLLSVDGPTIFLYFAILQYNVTSDTGNDILLA
ncbi:O-antigen ligase family protein [Mucilaginibacter sp. AW1-7]|uniref:O-antigen ligase family protein n=1 Tax=Mucilaginibacter sp. AW1-7 TaxID=3349874 RepID=UPI003F7405AE